jgi:hypothetical protein
MQICYKFRPLIQTFIGGTPTQEMVQHSVRHIQTNKENSLKGVEIVRCLCASAHFNMSVLHLQILYDCHMQMRTSM